MRASNRFRARFRQTEKTHFAFAHQVRHHADCFFNRRVGIDPMLVIKVDNFHAEPLQASFACLAHVIRFARDTTKLRIFFIAHDAELGRDHDLFAMIFDRAAEEFFIRVRAVHVRRVEKRDAQLKRAANRGERFLVITSTVKIGHAHAAQAQRGNYRTATSQFSLLHICPIQIRGAYSSQRWRIA